MKKILIVGLVFGFLVGQSGALVTELVGGVRDGLAVGLQLEDAAARNLTLRGGVAFNTGQQPVIGYIGGKFPLTSVGKMPLALGLGLVGYFGNDKSDVGFSLSFIFNRFFDLKPLFFEVGVDAAGKGKLLAQLGYKIY